MSAGDEQVRGSRTTNPFANSGGIVHGPRFIGREEALEVIEERVILPKAAGSIAIVGDTRVGKSSLAYQALMVRQEELAAKRIVVIWVNLGTYQRSSSFFRDLVTLTEEELTIRGLSSQVIRLKAERALSAEVDWSQGYTRMNEFFEAIRREEIRVIVVIDEFDHAREVFRGDSNGFQALRNLCYYPQWKVSFVLTSRRRIKVIEVETAAISTFNLAIGSTYYLGMFDEDEMDVFWGRLSDLIPHIAPEQRQHMSAICGTHPYLLDLLSFELVRDSQRRNSVDVNAAAEHALPGILDYYETVVNLLRREGSLNNLLQILYGPVFDIGEADLVRFLRYGLIREVDSGPDRGSYTAFSPHFQDYLRIEERSINLWPVWHRTETTLREFIADRLTMAFGADWVDTLRQRPKLQPIVETWKTAAQREHRNFGYRSSRRLIDFSYPRDLFTIMFATWDLFSTTMGHDTSYWNERGEFLARVRNPLAHGRDRVLPQREREKAEQYCAELLELITPAVGIPEITKEPP